MTLTLEVTGEVISEVNPLTGLIIDDKNMLGVEYEALRKIIAQMVGAINTLHQQVETCKDVDEQLLDSVQHLEQQLSSFEVRSRECEDTCQEMRLQLGTMAMDQKSSAEPVEQTVSAPVSELSRKDMAEIDRKIDQLKCDLAELKGIEEANAQAFHSKAEMLENTLERHQDFFDEDLEHRMQQSDDERGAIRAEMEAMRNSIEDISNQKASKEQVGEFAIRVETLDGGLASMRKMLEEASKEFTELDRLGELVRENQSKMQDMWSAFSKEAQEMREWASTNFLQLRGAVCSKMSEQEGKDHITEIRKEVRDLAPFLSEAMARVEASMNHKAEANEVQRLADDVEQLNRTAGKPKQLLMGTKCLACEREVHTSNATETGPVSLVDKQQEQMLWNDVQRAIDKKVDHRPGQKDVLRYVAIHVGDATRMNATVGHGFYDCRDFPEPGTHHLVKVGAGGGAYNSRPNTVGERSPAREHPPLYRVSPRRPQKLAQATAPLISTTLRPDMKGPNKTLKKAIGSAADNVPPARATDPATTAPLGDSEAYTPVRMQPAAHTGMSQRSATDFDADDIDPYADCSDSPNDAYVVQRH